LQLHACPDGQSRTLTKEMDVALELLEQQPHWQFTGLLDGVLIVVMRGHEGAPYPKGYYTVEGAVPGKRIAADFFRRKSASGDLKVLRGSIPTDDNE
jgi:hypothetical protein